MMVRFLQVTASAAPGVPFMPGQVIHLAGMTHEVRGWLNEGRVELASEEPEVATVGASERAVLPTAARRKRVSARDSV